MNQPNEPIDLPHLVRVCEAATPGEWTAFILANGNGGDATPDFIAEYVKATILKSEQESGTTEFMFISCEKPDGRADICHVGNGPTSKQNAQFIATFNPSTVLVLLRRLEEAEERVKQLEDVIHPPSIAPTGGVFAGLPGHLQPQGIDPAYLREKESSGKIGGIRSDGSYLLPCGHWSAYLHSQAGEESWCALCNCDRLAKLVKALQGDQVVIKACANLRGNLATILKGLEAMREIAENVEEENAHDDRHGDFDTLLDEGAKD